MDDALQYVTDLEQIRSLTDAFFGVLADFDGQDRRRAATALVVLALLLASLGTAIVVTNKPRNISMCTCTRG
mgnify:CR=1 FL=1